MEIRSASGAEAGPLAALWLRSRAASVPSIPPTVHTDGEVHRWFEEVVLPSRDVWVAGDQGGAIALLVVDHEWIDQLYVDPASTGGGVGGALLRHAMRLRPAGLKLWTFQSNLGARRFYEGHGFVTVASTAGDNEEGAPDVCYEWRPAGGTLNEGTRPPGPVSPGPATLHVPGSGHGGRADSTVHRRRPRG
jgi:GNAT superfamily N-acetyltransferase